MALSRFNDPFMPFLENTPTPDDLPSLSAAEIAALPVELLAILQREIDERLKRDKAAKTRFDSGLAARYATRAAEERQLLAKDTGTVRFDDGDFTVVADLPKRVDWDQGRLADMVARIEEAGDDPSEYVDLAFKVPERKPVREMTVFSPGNEMSISLLLYPDQAPSRWEMAELEEEDAVDTFDKFTGHSGH